MSIKINVAVYWGDQRVDSAPRRPARCMSNDVVGAVYSGLVYPVYKFGDDDFRIDLKDQGIDKDSVPDFWPSDSELIFTPPKKSEIMPLNCYVESNFYRHYLVFDGDEALLNQVLKCLVKNGVGVKRHGESIRRADDGHRYDWFVRLGSDDDRDAVIQRISKALRGVGQGESDDLKEQDIPLTSKIKQEAILVGVDTADPDEIIPWKAGVINHERESQKKATKQTKPDTPSPKKTVDESTGIPSLEERVDALKRFLDGDKNAVRDFVKAYKKKAAEQAEQTATPEPTTTKKTLNLPEESFNTMIGENPKNLNWERGGVKSDVENRNTAALWWIISRTIKSSAVFLRNWLSRSRRSVFKKRGG